MPLSSRQKQQANYRPQKQNAQKKPTKIAHPTHPSCFAFGFSQAFRVAYLCLPPHLPFLALFSLFAATGCCPCALCLLPCFPMKTLLNNCAHNFWEGTGVGEGGKVEVLPFSCYLMFFKKYEPA